MKILSKIYTWLIFAFLYAPIVVLIVFSFNNSKSRSVWAGEITFKWYVELFKDREIMDALLNTLLVAVVSAIVATIIGTFAAIGIHSMNKKLRNTWMMVNNIPMVNPEIVTGVSLGLMFTFFIEILKNLGFDASLNMLTLILAHITFNIPYVVLSVYPKLRQMNPYSYEAALDLGCTPIKSIFKVVLPEIMPGVITGLIMAFTLSLDDFVISYFTSGPSAQTLPLVIYAMTKRRISPKVNALSAIMFAVVLILLIIVNLRQSKDNKSNDRKEKSFI
ncbi:MAG: ABC transporter permease [Clostridia bacterium]|nr:ABC transporter permease [Clostridia bacterium]